MPNPVIHWEITGKDASKLRQFYADLFGWDVNANNPMNYGLVDTQTEAIEIRRLGDAGYDGSAEIHDSGVISTTLIPGLEVRLDDVFAQD